MKDLKDLEVGDELYRICLDKLNIVVVTKKEITNDYTIIFCKTKKIKSNYQYNYTIRCLNESDCFIKTSKYDAYSFDHFSTDLELLKKEITKSYKKQIKKIENSIIKINKL